MAKKDIAIVFDCGATNVRVIAIDTKGRIIASGSTPNKTDSDPFYPDGLIWDVDKIWSKLCAASVEVAAQIDTERIAGITVTTFGVDGTLVDADGNMLYPVISWQCKRTEEVMDSIGKYMPVEKIYSLSGVYAYPFNTINKLVWFKENEPEILERAHRFLFFPSLLIQKLTGEMKNDITMAGTSMTMDIKNKNVSKEIFRSIGVKDTLFGDLAQPGELAGSINKTACYECGLPFNTPVFFAGHDTQFAIFGSGAGINQIVLSSGTWEILMARSKNYKASDKELKNALTTELDSQPGVYNIGQNWLGSGVLEWFARNFYPELKDEQLFETMISEAENIEPGSHGLSIDSSFYKESGGDSGGVIKGLTINTTRTQIYRALLESLTFRLREGLELLQDAGGFKAEKIICVGGGAKNRLWNQLRADVCNVPVELIDQKETTVLGAALFVFTGAGIFASEEEARSNVSYNPDFIYPSSESNKLEILYSKYLNFKGAR